MNAKKYVKDNISLWSKELQSLTESTLYKMNIVPIDNKYRLKHHSSGENDYHFGFITIANLLSSIWIIENDEGSFRLHYGSLTDLINDGWAVD